MITLESDVNGMQSVNSSAEAPEVPLQVRLSTPQKTS